MFGIRLQKQKQKRPLLQKFALNLAAPFCGDKILTEKTYGENMGARILCLLFLYRIMAQKEIRCKRKILLTLN
jgi:hypothetical protein